MIELISPLQVAGKSKYSYITLEFPNFFIKMEDLTKKSQFSFSWREGKGWARDLNASLLALPYELKSQTERSRPGSDRTEGVG